MGAFDLFKTAPFFPKRGMCQHFDLFSEGVKYIEDPQ